MKNRPADKWVIVVPDGMYDYPQESLGGLTPLEAASTPAMDRLAREGAVGLLQTVPAGVKPGSDVAILTIVGCDVKRFYTGRAPLEAVAMGIELADDERAFRMNLVTVADGRLEDFSAGHIETGEARVLVEALQEAFGSDRYSFYTGVGYRHIMKRKGEALDVRSFPPHDVMGKVLGEILPSGPGAAEIVGLMKRSQGLLESHPVNVGRRERGEKSANMIWLWGDGPRPRMPSFQESFGLSGACITAVDLIRGIGILLGWKHIAVKGATGYLDTDYAAKGEAAVWAMEGHDLVFVHIEAPDEAGHEGDARAKCESIARVDELIVEPILRAAAKRGGTRFAVLGDHFTPVKLRTHSGEPVPFAVWGPGISSSGCAGFGERSARSSGLFVEEGHQFMERFIGGEFHDPGAREKSPGRRRGGGC